ncbi:hypothetical protein BN1058_02209 [Paraliobacillus sp. PM-2]|uniref:DUF6449 domain-containing protein n=1 Tax=Paraliobacillus sp. PM-2 TaxID=1462524 RepID=UPI00061C4922|nr:DUF6449 domain-containing protein [Paraliobacillus sp. PM-2]CQR47877.1 hypothetical protein BN1058_02209 [Paraliobacillus sp. PM-2]
MQSKTSWYKKELVKQDFRQVGWISLIYTVILIFVLPLNIAMYLSQDDMNRYITSDTYTNLFQYITEIQILTIFIAPVLLAIFLFRYMQTKQSADFMHSLPMKRQVIFFHKVGLGIALLAATDLIICLILVFMEWGFDVSLFYTLSDIAPWFGLSLLLQTFVFVVAVFVGMLTGVSAIQGVFTYIFLLFPVGISMLVMYNLNYVLIGFPDNYFLEDQLLQYSPITYSWELLHNMNVSFVNISIYLCFILFITGLSLWLYTKRKVEAASQAIAFSPLRPIFKYGFTFCMTLVGGFYFGEVQNNYGWLIFGYIFGSVFGYILAQMILKKTWRVFTEWRSYFYYVLGCGLLFMLISLDITGYQNRIPDTADIDQVYVNEQSPNYWNQKNGYDHNGITSTQLISNVRKLHQILITSSDRSQIYNHGNDTIELRYELENGHNVVRKYNVPNIAALDDFLKPIYESKEYKKMNYPIFLLDENKVNHIEINILSGRFQAGERITENTQINALMHALKEDVFNMSYEDIRHPTNGLVDISIRFNDNQHPIYVPIQSNYSSFFDWLKNHGLYEDVIVTADDVNALYIHKFTRDSDQIYNRDSYLNSDKVIKFTGEAEITSLLQSISQRGAYQQDTIYGIAIDLKRTDELIIQILESTKVPDFVLDVIE